MGPLLVGAVVGWGRWADGSTWLLRALVPAAASALAPAALGDCGACPAAAARSRLLPGVTAGRDGSCGAVAPAAWGDFGVGANRGLILCREVNDLIWTPEALAFFDRYFLRFCCANPAVLRSKGVDAPGLRFYSFTSRESIRAQLIEVPLWRRSPASSSLDWGKQPRLSNCEPAQTYLRGCLHNSRYYVCEVLKGAAGGHDDVCFAFGRNPACR